MSSSSGAEATPLTTPTEQQQQANTLAMDAKLMVATGSSGHVHKLKDLVNKQEEDSCNMMVVVMAKQQEQAAAAASVENETNQRPQQGKMLDPHLLALVCSGSRDKLLLQQASSFGVAVGDDTEATIQELELEGVTAEGDTALHVVAASCAQVHDERWMWWHWCLTTRAERHEWSTSFLSDRDDNFLASARIIYGKAKHLLFAHNNNGDTPLHCAARAGKPNMVACLIHLALADGGQGRMKELLREENKHKETALHEAIRVGNNHIVDLLMAKDPELANFPPQDHRDGGASPLYLAIMLRRDEIAKTLYDKSRHGMLSFSGPNGKNALHAAVLRYPLRE